MISRNDFNKYMVEADRYLHSKLGTADILCDFYVEMLTKLCKDQQEIIEWFVFEADFGRKERIFPYDGGKLYIDSINRLYDFLYMLDSFTQPSQQSSTGPH